VVFFQRKQPEKSYLIANDAVKYAEQFNLQKLRVPALVERAYANLYLDKAAKAKRDITLAQRYLLVLQDDFNKAIILERLSGAVSLLKDIKLALILEQQAIDILTNVAGAHYLSIAYYNLSRNHHALNNVLKAKDSMELSYQWAIKDNNNLNQAFSLYRLAQYQTQLGHHKQAEQSLLAALKASDESNSVRVKVIVRKEMATFLCRTNKIEHCEELLIKTIDYAKRYSMLADLKELSIALAELYYQQEKYQKAYNTLKSIL